LKKRLHRGDQAFVISPIIEATGNDDLKSAKKMEKSLKKILRPSFKVGLIHGRLRPDERIRIMTEFRKGLIHLLVGTTVIEVGIHVPNATIMIIEHPERFGLAQLHQLRGRIGRGKKGGICFLMKSENISEKAFTRLRTLVDEDDGFKVAQKDLELRGHGELTGTRQSGVGELDFAELVREPELLFDAKREAQNIISSDPELLLPEHSQLRLMIDSIDCTLAD
jgi:ATP-dependent DNA helicase RecG